MTPKLYPMTPEEEVLLPVLRKKWLERTTAILTSKEKSIKHQPPRRATLRHLRETINNGLWK